jgi:hypothetical protein
MNKKAAAVYLMVLLIVVDAELAMTYYSVTAGLCIYALLLFALIALSILPLMRKKLLKERLTDRYMLKPVILAKYFPTNVDVARTKDASMKKEDDFSNFLKCLTLAPLIRILSTAMPIATLEQIFWYAIINAPLLVVAYLIVRAQGLGLKSVGIRMGNPATQLAVGCSGILLGVMDYSLLRPSPLIASLDPAALILPALILLIFTGFSEELVFRGIIQKNAEKMMGGFNGLVLTSALFAAMHIGWKSFPDLIFVFGVGMFFGYVYQKTGSLMGITLAHGITNITMFLIAPFIL